MKEKYSRKNLDHLGVVSQICDEIGIVEVIDKLILSDPQMKLSHGICSEGTAGLVKNRGRS